MELCSVFLPTILLLLLSVLYSAILFFKRSAPPKATESLVLKSYPVIGNLPHFIKNGRRLLEWTTDLIASSPTGTVTVAPIVFTANPTNVEHVARTNFQNYPKGGEILSTFHDFLGRGIFNSNGEEWLLQRKAASFEFNTKSLRAFVLDKVRHETVDRLIPLLKRAGRSGEVLDLQDVLERFAFDNICSLVFGEDPKCLALESEDGERFYHAFHEATELSIERAKQPFSLIWKLSKWLDLESERRLRESMETVHGLVEKYVRSRRKLSREGGGSDFLSRFAADGAHSDEFIRDILISFVLAGRDTTPTALTWFFWILSSKPEVVEKIREEIRVIRSQRRNYDSEVLTLDELREMGYLHAALSESMRIYPPVPLRPCESRREDELPDGTRVRKGWTVMYSTYAMGRAEGIWGQDCGEFRPERWMEDGVFQPASPFRYTVFHAGPRMCLGKDMAYIQMKAVAASILEGFEVEVVENRGKHHLSMTMRMEGGLPVRIKERNIS
ncbi:cytochrome P450 94A1-like [Phoenix dactylifera]|uniref:Cytochrome P450 94A1-like n=1 Tax=Phoenix dactylifera TaxID=42345 RepID=A0A8B7MWS4_PHODC|nr:cytochrome P450 94A1-like [Phoenix dactylifera]